MPDPYDPQAMKRLRMFVYLIPVIGFFPALWSLYRKQGDRREQIVSRTAVVMALVWIVGYVSLGSGAQSSESLGLSLWIANSVLTSGYFVTNLWLMLRLWQGKSTWLPGVSEVGDRLP
ncbi:MAG TPA: hypothetical protein IGS37_12675 [Synechococcales cyanobacterium M55_K2018_004]|nr:hypothetical protein [Synechococcales cyanobacterium M55_K2018_004]